MSIHYAFKPENNVLIVETSGFDETLEEVMQYGLSVIEEAKNGNYTRVLCNEIDLEYRLGTFDIYELAAFTASSVSCVARVAVVCNSKFMADAAFWETVSVNRGLEARVFKDLDKARLWLKE